MTIRELRAIRKRLRNAGKGPWVSEPGMHYDATLSDADGRHVCVLGDVLADDNIMFIVNAPTDIANLLDEVERLKKLLNQAEAMLGVNARTMRKMDETLDYLRRR